ncbi:Spermidine N1-acetyltransferase [Klebsiella pneumoniae subsp. rhinoscleromatis]|nr:Spermidine N1-acetyltransferase [Klebsiella pneumoniae subsp. rhinoscleromatis]
MKKRSIFTASSALWSEGELIHEFFINGEYRNTIRMCLFQHQYLAEHKTPGPSLLKPTAQ